MTLNLGSTGTQGDEPDGGAKRPDASSPDAHLGMTSSKARSHLSAGHGVYALGDAKVEDLRAAHNQKHHRGGDGAVVTTEANPEGINQYTHAGATSVPEHVKAYRGINSGRLAGHLQAEHGRGPIPSNVSRETQHAQHMTAHAAMNQMSGASTKFATKKHTESQFDDTIDELIAAVVALDLPDSSELRAESIETEDHMCWGHDCAGQDVNTHSGATSHVDQFKTNPKELIAHIARNHGQAGADGPYEAHLYSHDENLAHHLNGHWKANPLSRGSVPHSSVANADRWNGTTIAGAASLNASINAKLRSGKKV